MAQLFLPHLAAVDPETCACGVAADYCKALCLPAERVLRLYSGGVIKDPMTTEQREECLTEINRVEGFDRKDYEKDSDTDLARGVLVAWLSFCRDKGLCT